MKRSFFLISFILFFHASFAQPILPFVDFNNFLSSYENGFFRQVEIQPISNLKIGDELAAYLDIRKNLVLYDGNERKNITILNAEYEVSDHLMAFKVAGSLKVWDKKIISLTSFASEFCVKDSLVVFLDGRTRSLNLYKDGKTKLLCNLFDEMKMPKYIGDNILVFKDASQTYNAFWNDQIFEVGVYNQSFNDFPGTDLDGNVSFSVGCDVFCFNDPYTQSFVVFENGELFDVDLMPAKNFMAARGFVVYEDINGNLWHYADGNKTQLTNFSASKWHAKDDVVIWVENGYLYAFQNGVKSQVINYIPQEYLLKNNQIVYKNILGGVSAFTNGDNIDLTNQQNAVYSISGDKILVQLINQSAIVLDNGKTIYK